MFVVVTRGSRAFSVLGFLQQKLSLGRNIRNDLLLTNSSTSKHHCVLHRQGDRVTITDLNSTNGVYLNNQKITEAVEIYPNDVVEIGDYSLALHVPAPHEPMPAAVAASLSDGVISPETCRAVVGRWVAADQRLASCPETPQDVLETLSMRFDLEVLRGVAQNPNTPASAMARLMFLYPDEVLQNPAMPLLFLENPSGDWLPHEALTATLRHELCPKGLLELYQNHQDLAFKNAVSYHQQKQRARAKARAEEVKARVKASHVNPINDIATKVTPSRAIRHLPPSTKEVPIMTPPRQVPLWAKLLAYFTVMVLIKLLLR